MQKLILYHYSMSGSSQKLRLVLAEKDLSWEGHIVDLLKGDHHGPAYREINPAGFVPTLFHGNIKLTEVAATLEYLDDVFPSPPLRPSMPVECHRMRCWVKMVDEIVHPANGLLSYAIAARPAIVKMSSQEIEAYLQSMPNARDRRLRRIAIEKGMDCEEFGEAALAHDRLLQRMEAHLVDTEFLAGPAVSLADFTVLPYVKRLQHLGIGPMLHLSKRPGVTSWLNRMTSRPSYKTAIVDHLPPGIDDAAPVENADALAAVRRYVLGDGTTKSAVQPVVSN